MNKPSKLNEGFRILDDFVCQAIIEPSVLPSLVLNVEVDWSNTPVGQWQDEISRALPNEHRGHVVLRVEPSTRQGGNPAQASNLVQALIEGGTAVVSAFIATLLERVQSEHGKSVVITPSNNTRYELPINASPEQILQVAATLEGAESAHVEILR